MGMKIQMAFATKPSDERGFCIIHVMHLALFGTANLAGFLWNLAALEIDMRVTPRVHLESLHRVQWMGLSPFSNICRMARKAVTTIDSALVSTFTHLTIQLQINGL